MVLERGLVPRCPDAGADFSSDALARDNFREEGL